MVRLGAILLFSLFASMAHANDFEDADKAWTRGSPWPEHWGRIFRPYKEGWNVIALAFVHKLYPKDGAAETWLKDIPYAMQKDASVEICMVKRGLLEVASPCYAALVDPEIAGTLQEEDVVAFFYSNHGTRLFSKGPGTDPKSALRVFQKVADHIDSSCWVREALVFKRPVADACFQRVDMARVERVLTREFGPKEGAVGEARAATSMPSEVNAATKDAKSDAVIVNSSVSEPAIEIKSPATESKPEAPNDNQPRNGR